MGLNATLSIYKTLRKKKLSKMGFNETLSIMKLNKMGFNSIVNLYTKLSTMTISIKALNMAPSIMTLRKVALIATLSSRTQSLIS